MMRETRKIVSVLVLGALLTAMLPGTPAYACATCFGDPEAPQTQGLNGAIVTLLGITYTLLGGIALGVFFIIRNGRRADADGSENPEEAGHG